MSDSPPQGSDGPLKRQSASSSKFKPHLLAKVSNELRRHSDGSVHTDSMQSHTKERLKILNRNSDANGEKRRKNSRRKHNSNQRVSRRSPSRLHFIESPTATTTEQTTERPFLVSTMPLRTRSTRAPRLRASPASPATFKTKLEPIPEFTSLRPKQHWSNCLPDSILNSPSDDESSTHELTTKQIVFQRSASAPTSIEPVATLTPDRDAKGRMRRRARPYFVSRRTFAKRPASEPIVVGASSSSSSSSSSSMWAATSSSSSRYSVPPLPDRTPGNAEHNAPLIDATVDALRRRASDGGDVCLASPDRDIEFLDEIITAVKGNYDLPLLEPRERSNSA